MKKREFVIPFVGLKETNHEFKFELEASFFESLANQDITDPKIVVDLQFDKSHEPYVLVFKITGSYIDQCDRCARDVRIPVYGKFKLFLEIGNTENLRDETEVIYITRDTHDIDLYEHIRDFVLLSFPLVKRCESEADLKICDERVNEFLNKVNNTSEEQAIDPRWASLKKLKQ